MRYAPAIRIYLGLVWLINGGLKLGDPTFTQPGGQCQRWLVQFTAGTSGPYHLFVHQVVIPHVTLFATLVEWSETLVGLALIAGLLTRLSACGSIFLAVNYWVMRGAYMTVGGYVDIEPILIALAGVVLFWPATRAFSLGTEWHAFSHRHRLPKRAWGAMVVVGDDGLEPPTSSL